MANENRKAHWLDVTGELWSRLGLKNFRCSSCGYETGIRTDKCFNCCAEMENKDRIIKKISLTERINLEWQEL